jgi:hypothetical protein
VFGEDLLLPDKGLLLHVGPHKTGTTAIQGALQLARRDMAKQGVIYAGKGRQSQMAALAITGGKGLTGFRPADQKDWDELVAQVRQLPDKRIVVSSEYFDECTDEMAGKVVEDLGADRVHVVVTLRPLAKIMPSAWQQYVRNGLRRPYSEWLDGILLQPPYDKPTPSFWRRHHHDVIVERWVKILGPDRVVAVVLDESDPDNLMRTFERFLGLPNGMLEPESDGDNRSLTAAETELVRQLNLLYHARKWPPEVYNDVIRLGLIKQMQRRQSRRDEPGIATPRWAVDRANEIGAEAAQRIQATGAHIHGDLASLSNVAPKDIDPEPPPLTTDAAIAALEGAIQATGVLAPKKSPKKAASGGKKVKPAAPTLAKFGTRELATELRHRVVTRYARKGPR